jgi:hypothetical protein
MCWLSLKQLSSPVNEQEDFISIVRSQTWNCAEIVSGSTAVEDRTGYINRVTRPVATSAAAQTKSKFNHALRKRARPTLR